MNTEKPWRPASLLGRCAVVTLLAGCGSHSKAPLQTEPGSRAPIARSASDEFHYNDPCSLLEAREVEAVMGAPLGTPPYRANNLSPAADGADCIYQTADFHEISVTVVFKEGAQDYRIRGYARRLTSQAPDRSTKEALMLDDGTELSGEWDEASLTAFNCCIFNALRGDQVISVDFTGSDATLRQVATLVDSAFKRIDSPLKIDGGANIAAARTFLARRPKPIAPCEVLSQAEVEAVVGPLAMPPKKGGSVSCDYQLSQESTFPPRLYELSYLWQGGFASYRSDAHVGRIAGMAMGGKLSNEPPPLPLGGPGDPWERGGILYNDFVAVKNDVRIKIDQRFTDHDKAKALVALAMRKF